MYFLKFKLCLYAKILPVGVEYQFWDKTIFDKNFNVVGTLKILYFDLPSSFPERNEASFLYSIFRIIKIKFLPIY